MMFDWDTTRHERNLRQRGVGFDTAAAIFAGPVIEWRDERHGRAEERMVALGTADGLILVVGYADRGNSRHIVSARPALRKERLLWQLFVAP